MRDFKNAKIVLLRDLKNLSGGAVGSLAVCCNTLWIQDCTTVHLVEYS